MIWLVIKNMIRMVDRISENQRGVDDQTFFCCPGCNYLWQFPHRTWKPSVLTTFVDGILAHCSVQSPSTISSHAITHAVLERHQVWARKLHSYHLYSVFIQLLFSWERYLEQHLHFIKVQIEVRSSASTSKHSSEISSIGLSCLKKATLFLYLPPEDWGLMCYVWERGAGCNLKARLMGKRKWKPRKRQQTHLHFL